MKRHLRLLLAASLLLPFVYGCGEEKVPVPENAIAPPSRVRVNQICQAYLRRDYSGLISMMHNYKDQSSQYQEQLALMLKQSDWSDSVRICNMVANQMSISNGGVNADLYVDVYYSNDQNEEIIIPMIYDQGKWWIK